jgi:HSP20 family protein
MHSTDLVETSDCVYITIDVPGIKRQDISLTYKEATRSVTIKSNCQRSVKSGKYILAERNLSPFSRVYKLPADFVYKMEGFKAKLEDGVLYVDIPKIEKPEVPINIA